MDKHMPDGEYAGKLKGVRIESFSLWMVSALLIVSSLIGYGIVNVMKNHRELSRITQEYILVQEEAKDLLLGSDYLTDQARLYVVTKDCRYAEAYFTEAEETKRRDQALKALEEHFQGRDGGDLEASRDAMRLSNELMDLEIHAMKLSALSVDEDERNLSPRIREYSLTEEELSDTKEEKAKAAMELVFGDEYRDMKRRIEEKMSSVTKHVVENCEKEQRESESAMKIALTKQGIYTVLIVILVVFSYVMIAVLILRPIRIYVNCIRRNDFLDITGAYEFRYLAATYNNVYAMTLEQQSTLKKKAERDAVTGLLNRQSFEQLKERFSNSGERLAFLLLDVDVFKEINDHYGHDKGDKALIKVADLLDEKFRSADYVLRIGGDEFAIVMEKMTVDNKQIIRDKIDSINEILQHPQGDFPKYSLSVGIAFSTDGFHDELFNQADQALYHTKETGRCGYTFYDELS